MLTLILTAALGALGALGAPTETAATAPVFTCQNPDNKALKALHAWLKLYRKGRIDYRSDEDNTKHSIAVKYKLRSKGDLGNSTWAGDLRLILEAVARRNDAEAARALGEVAAVGLDDGKYTYAMAPYSVRSAALEQVAKLTGHDAKAALAAGARGEWKARR
ncbi:MAG TPA: hypothetical protein ENI87_11395, partial [bacterium]|nr:hypothetical protein [bacterium]